MKDQTSVFKYFDISHIFRAENARTDALSQLAITAPNELGQTYIEYLDTPSIERMEEVLQINDEPNWMDPIIRHLTEGTLSDDPSEAKCLRWIAS